MGLGGGGLGLGGGVGGDGGFGLGGGGGLGGGAGGDGGGGGAFTWYSMEAEHPAVLQMVTMLTVMFVTPVLRYVTSEHELPPLEHCAHFDASLVVV